MNRQQKKLRELQRACQQQSERIQALEGEIERLLDNQDETQSALEDAREVLKANKLEVARSPYEQQVRQIRDRVRQCLPRNAIVLVASKGDPEAVRLSGRIGWHFPRNPEGQYAGYYPANGSAAIAHLEAWRAEGAQYLLFPSSAFWWFDHYPLFTQHLERCYRQVLEESEICRIYSLRDAAATASPSLALQIERMIAEFQRRYDRDPAILDCSGVKDLASMLPQLAVFAPPTGPGLPYMDRSVDIVIASAADPDLSREARRVALAAVATVGSKCNGADPGLTVQWQTGGFELEWPMVSLIMPCDLSRATTLLRLSSIRETLPGGFRGEIILVNTSLGKVVALPTWRDLRVKVVSAGFGRSYADLCNVGAGEASSEILVFLNPDWLLLSGWLPPLLRVFRDFPQAGVVGGKLLASDGTLHEAGGVVFRNGATLSLGGGDSNLDAPLFNFVREVDYCSSALWATRRSLWELLGGLDTSCFQGFCEDLDYCFKIRDQGSRVYYQPESAAVRRGGSPPVAAMPGPVKLAQAISQMKFANRWQAILQSHPVLPEKPDPANLQTLAFRTHCLNSRA